MEEGEAAQEQPVSQLELAELLRLEPVRCLTIDPKVGELPKDKRALEQKMKDGYGAHVLGIKVDFPKNNWYELFEDADPVATEKMREWNKGEETGRLMERSDINSWPTQSILRASFMRYGLKRLDNVPLSEIEKICSIRATLNAAAIFKVRSTNDN